MTGWPFGVGSSPLTRGKPGQWVRRDATRGLIPAHAGKTARRPASFPRNTAHPRSRGENVMRGPPGSCSGGSSPLTRGKPLASLILPALTRLIPAHAGKTLTAQRLILRAQAHPRSRGENFGGTIAALADWGSSPLTRGKPSTCRRRRVRPRLIPAHAGKTTRHGPVIYDWAAHPRSRGENTP